MNAVKVTKVPLSEVAAASKAIEYALEWSAIRVEGGVGAAFTVPDEYMPDWGEQGVPLSIFVLPDSLEFDLVGLAGQRFSVINRPSTDLLTCRTFIQLATHRACVEIDAWLFDTNFFNSETGRYFVGLIAGGTFVLASHQLDMEEVEHLQVDLQSSCACSGPNYKPYRIWSDEELAEASQRPASDEFSDLAQCQQRVECFVAELS